MNENLCNKHYYKIDIKKWVISVSIYVHTYVQKPICQSFSTNIPDEARGHVVCFMQITGRVLRTCEFVCK